MTPQQYIVATYVLFWIIRVYGCFRRGRQPMLRGNEWFFSVRVPDGFYEGAGRTILRRYRLRMLIPFAIDIPFAIAIFLSGRIVLLNVLILGLCVVVHVAHLYNVELAERQARSLSIPEKPVVVALSLETRRVRDYTSWPLEIAIVLINAGIVAWLIHYVATRPTLPSLWPLFAAPVLVFYLQAGMLFTKWLIVTWRTPVPYAEADDYMKATERRRRFHLQMCDFGRLSFALALLFVPIRLSVTPATLTRVLSAWLIAWLLAGIALTIWGEIRRKQVIVHPIQPPDFQRLGDVVRPLICYEPSAPALMVRSANGLSLNLASRVAQVGFLYFAGLIALLAVLPKLH